MRISTAQTFEQGMNAITDQHTRLARAQMQLSTGRRSLTPADDPPAAARAIGVQEAIESTRQFQLNADAAAERLGLEDGVLAGVVNVLQRVRELAVQANSGALANEQRSSIATEIEQRLEELLGLANSRDGRGEYLFAGFQGKTHPFVQSGPSTVSYNGDQGQRWLQIGSTRQIAAGDSGHAVFRAMTNGNGTFVADLDTSVQNTGTGVIDVGSLVQPQAYVQDTYTITFVTNANGDLAYRVDGDATGQVVPAPPADPVADAPTFQSGGAIAFNGLQTAISGQPAAGDTFLIEPSGEQDIFSTLLTLLDVLRTPVRDAASAAQLSQGMSRGLNELDRALEHIDAVRAAVGTRLSAIDSQKEVNEFSTLQFQQTLSEIQDLDYAEAISRLNRDLLALQAAQQTFVKVQGLSLFNFLR